MYPRFSRRLAWFLLAVSLSLTGVQSAIAQDQADKTPPVLVEFSVATTFPVLPLVGTYVDVRSGPADITFTVRVTDDISGVKLVSVYLINPANLSQEICTGGRDSGDEKDGIYTCVVTMPQNSGDGAWVITVFLSDQTDNSAIIAGNPLAVLLAPTTILVANLDLPPTLGVDSYTTDEDSVLVVAAANSVLANDSDDGGGVLEAILADPTSNGLIELAADGTFTYTPDLDFFGSDAFVYQASDGNAISDSIEVTIDVAAVNDPPVVKDASIQVEEDVPSVLTLQGTDVEDDPITYTVATAPTLGTVTIDGDRATYTPNDGASGADSFTVIGSDGMDPSEEATIEVSVRSDNDAPSAMADAFKTDEDIPLVVASASGVLSNDSDPDADALEAVLEGSTRNGRLVLSEDGSLTYTPDADFHGMDGFTYRSTDGRATSGSVSVAITVAPVNDAPSAKAANLTLGQDSDTLTLLASDVDGDGLHISLDEAPSFGTVSLNGAVATYVPGPLFPGNDAFSFVAFDGELYSDPATVTVSGIGAVQRAVAVADSYSGTEDLVLAITTQEGLLANDTHPSGASLAAQLTTRPAHGSVSVSQDGSFEYTPDADFNGQDEFRYQASDGTMPSTAVAVTIHVSPINDAPGSPAILLPEDGSTVILSGDPSRELVVRWAPSTDAEGDPVSYGWVLMDDIGDILLSAEVSGGTEIRRSYGELAAVLTATGLATGALETLVHWVTATDGQAESRSIATEIRVFRGAITSVDTPEDLPERLMLAANYPNPFNPRTVLRFGLPSEAPVRLSVLDLMGRVVSVLLDRQMQAGWHEVGFDARHLASGTYLQVLQVGPERLTNPIIVSK